MTHSSRRRFNVTCSDGPDERDPRTIDWPTRQARAVVPFDVVDGIPVHPTTDQRPDLPEGRGDLWHWGEAVASDTIVTAIDEHGRRRLLLVERADGNGWALPGGMLDAGESPTEACVRELGEETGLVITAAEVEMLPGRLVPDPRAGRAAWMVTVPGRIRLGLDAGLPEVTGLDDAIRAQWVPAISFPTLHAELAVRGGQIFPAHVDMIREALS